TYRLCFSPDGSLLIATGMSDQGFRAWDLRSIRTQLSELGLDWDLPANSPEREPRGGGESSSGRSLSLVLDVTQHGPGSAASRGFIPPGITASIASSSKIIESDPRAAEAYHSRAVARVLLEEWPAALEDCNAALELGEKEARTYYLRGQVNEHLGRD